MRGIPPAEPSQFRSDIFKQTPQKETSESERWEEARASGAGAVNLSSNSELWTMPDSNRLPHPCHGCALPGELMARNIHTSHILAEKGHKEKGGVSFVFFMWYRQERIHLNNRKELAMKIDTRQQLAIYLIALTVIFGSALVATLPKERPNHDTPTTTGHLVPEQELLLSDILPNGNDLMFLASRKKFLDKLPQLKERYPDFDFIIMPPDEDQSTDALLIVIKKRERK